MQRGKQTPGTRDQGARQSAVDELSAALDAAGLYVGVELDGDLLHLTGEVDSDENHQAAVDLARLLAARHGLRIDDGIEVMAIEPDAAWELEDDDTDSDLSDQDILNELDPDFTVDRGPEDPEVSAAEAVPYFPPTDPVVAPSTDEEELRAVGGFQGTSMDEETTEIADGPRLDDDILIDVVRELHEDAETIDLTVEVDVRSGVVVLTGTVPTLQDAENAEAVAARVPGVVEVRERLQVPGLGGRDRGAARSDRGT